MALGLRISLLVAIAIYMGLIIFLLRKKSLNLKYSLLWMFMAVVLLVMVAFPDLVAFFANLIGVASYINAIFMAFIFFILLLIVSLSSIVSKQSREIKTLIQNLALLKKEIEEIKNRDI